ncbi:MAG: VCBS repeat-containing protein [Nannocystaceae bacterium]
MLVLSLRHRPLLSAPAALLLASAAALAGCGDDTGASASDSATSTSSTASEGATTDGGGSASDSATTTTSGGSMSDSNSVTSETSSAATSASASASASATSSESDSDTDATSDTDSASGTSGASGTSTETSAGTDTGGVDYCGDDPPAGFAVDPAECLVEPEVGTFNPVVEWKKPSFTAAPSSVQVVMAPVVGPLTDDDKDGVFGSAGDTPAIAFVTFTGAASTGPGVLRAIRGDTGEELFSNADAGLYGGSGLAIGDLDGDGKPEIVALASGGLVRAFDTTGAITWTSAGYQSDMATQFPYYSSPSIADLDGDGKPEVIVGRLILNGDGSLRGKGAHGRGGARSSASVAADLDGDGVQEVVVGDAVYAADGSTIWSNGQPDGFPAIADFDGDGEPEIAVVSAGALRLQDRDGAVLWSVALPGGRGGPPTIADFDGDAKPEIGVAGVSRYAVFEGDGALLWQRTVKDASSGETGSAVYDFEGDGVADVVYADEIDLYVFSGVDGSIKLQYAEHNSGTAIEYPVVADVDNDGEVEIVVAHNTLFGNGPETGVTVLGDLDASWRPGRRIWNQHAYSITNVDDHAAIPAKPAANWLTYNNFRSGDLSAPDGLSAPDLELVVPDACARECVGDDAQIWFQLGNSGGVAQLAGAEVEVYGVTNGEETLLDVVPVAGPIEAGAFLPAAAVVVPVQGVDELRLRAVSLETECVVDGANEATIEPPFCTP